MPGAPAQWRRMPAPNRPSILISAALAVATPLWAGAMIWRYLDDDRRTGLIYVLVYWPSILLDHLPERAAGAFTVSALPTVLLYFGGYLALCQGARALWRRIAR
jgi:hypothetical protein